MSKPPVIPAAPAPSSLAGQLIRYFAVNTDEQLSIEDIHIKFEEATNRIPDLLEHAVRNKWLVVAKGTRGLYGPGPMLLTHGHLYTDRQAPDEISATAAEQYWPMPETDAPHLPAAPAQPIAPTVSFRGRVRLPEIDVTAIAVEPLTPTSLHRHVGSRWDDLLARLQPGTASGPIPKAYGPSVGGAARNWRKRHPLQRHSVQTDATQHDHIRLYRLADGKPAK